MRAYYSAAWFLARSALGALSRWEVKGREHVPPSGGLLIASNHISFWDPPLVGSAVTREMYFLAKEELFATPLLGPLIRSVNAIPIRRGVADLSGLARAIAMVKAGGALLVFPEGTRMRDGELHPARPGVGMIAVHADVPVVPCYIAGSNRPARWLTWRERVRIGFGPARHWKDLAGPESDLTHGRALYQRVGDAVMREIAAIKSGQLNPVSSGVA